jgi:dTDP-4-amino-4,6-dideoxygalactose transaminase
LIPFNKPYLTGKETHYMYQAAFDGHLSGNGKYTKMCQAFFEETLKFKKCLLTTSCTDALEMSALLLNIKPGDEIIMPSFTFVSTALAFIRQGAIIKFVDSRPDHPGMDESQIEPLITSKTKALVAVHYAGVACDMDILLQLSQKYNLYLVEDAAQAIGATYNNKPLGTIGNMSCYSFHETKNIQCGEGGLIGINDPDFIRRSEIIWEKGTNRSEYFRGQVNKYEWVDLGSSFLPAEIVAAFLYAQLENINDIQEKRLKIWQRYNNSLNDLAKKEKIKLPLIPSYASNNAHMYYVLCDSLEQRSHLISYLKSKDILAVFHYIPLHSSPYYRPYHDGRQLSRCDHYSNTLLRLPLYYELSDTDVDYICDSIKSFFNA